MTVTINNHYIPCFWTAFWNYDYFHAANIRERQKPREQEIFVFNLTSNKILPSKTKKVFFEKKLGIAEISENKVLDFEPFFTQMENLISSPLEKIIIKNEISTLEEKTQIASFIMDLGVRNYENFKKQIENYVNNEKQKIDFFIDLKNHYSNPRFLMNIIISLISSEWTVFKSEKFKFPIGDSPLLFGENDMFLALSPKMLIQINFDKKVLPNKTCCIHKIIDNFTFKDFRNRVLIYSKREIIFNDNKVLEDWKALKPTNK